MSIRTVNRLFRKELDSATKFPGFHLPKLDFRHSFYPQASVFPLSISRLTEVFFCPGWEWESSCGGGRRASWLIRILQREKSWVVLRLGVWVWNTGWHRPRRLQPKMHTLKILFTETSTKCADLGCVEGSVSQKCTRDLCRCLCRCFLIHWTSAFLHWASRHWH